MSGKRIVGRILLAACGLGLSLGALALEIKVLSAGAIKPVIAAAVPDFERRTGHRVTIENDTAGGLLRRVRAGEKFDLLVMPLPGLQQLAGEGPVLPAGLLPLARVGIGVAVKQGATQPRIATTADFRDALLAARKVAYIDPAAGGSSGIYLSQLFERMGIADQIRPKAVLVPGGLVAQRLVTGEADLAVHQISEILAVPGAALVGPIPAEVQNYTVYAMGLSARSEAMGPAQQLVSVLAGAPVRAQLAAFGMEAP
jgi:molybdate transport system substrate-binding protein